MIISGNAQKLKEEVLNELDRDKMLYKLSKIEKSTKQVAEIDDLRPLI